MILQPTNVDPAMKSALKNHIMRKRQQLKQELEQDAIEKRLKREQEAKRKQDAMTLDQLKDQLIQLEKTLDNLKNEKHSLFAQLKQNMRVLNEDDMRRKQKEGELQQQQRQQQQQTASLEQQQQQQTQSQQPPPPPPSSQQPATNPNALLQTNVYRPLVTNGVTTSDNNSSCGPTQLNVPLTLQSHQQQQETNNMYPSATQHREQATKRPPDPMPIMSPNKKIHTQPPTPNPPQHQQLPPPLSNPYLSYPGLPPNLASSSAPTLPASMFGPGLMRTPPPPNINSLFNSAAFSHLLNAHNFPRQPSYLAHLPQNRPPNPYSPMGPYPQLNQHIPSLITGHGIPTSLSHGIPTSLSHGIPTSLSQGGQPNPMMRPPPQQSTTNPSVSIQNNVNRPLTSNGLTTSDNNLNCTPTQLNVPLTLQSHQQQQESNSLYPGAIQQRDQATKRPPDPMPIMSPNKKIHTQPPTPNPPQHQQLPPPLSNPYLSYPGLPPNLASSSAPTLPASMFGPGLMRTPPPPNINSLFNSAAFSHLLNAHNFPRQPSYLAHLSQNRAQNPYGPMSPYPQLNQHIPSLITGHGIPTSLSHGPQAASMMRPSPPPNMNNSGPPKLPPLSLPITSSGPPTPMDFNPNLVSSTAHQMQQQAINNSAAARAAAAAAALGITGYNSPYFNPNSTIGPPSQF